MLDSADLTFMFTDIEGSTRLWDNHPDHMRSALARHDTIMRETIEEVGGQVFKTVGDQFCAVFPDVRSAIQGGLTAQIRLTEENWQTKGPSGTVTEPIRVRMAIHTGEAECREGEYSGPAIRRVAEVMALGHGGQTLLTLPTVDAVGEGRPRFVEFRDLGEHRLKDLQRPERIFQIVHPQLMDGFKPLRSLDHIPNNFPQQITSFVGRERELRDIKRLVTNAKLLTLTGAGGTGKTRLALQASLELLDPSADGSWIVEFGSITDPALVPQTLASTIGIREEPNRPVTETLIDYLKPKRISLLIDNAEHLLTPIARLVDRLIRQCPHLKILATSREPMSVNGEQTYRVPSLTFPETRGALSREEVVKFEAIRLFVDRAMLVMPTFQVTDQNVGAIVQICKRLDGIPMAIELAAARVRSLQVDQIAERLDDRFHLLTGGFRTSLPRQKTLRAMIDWSYDLLNDEEKTLFRRFSVFTGGWSLDAAEHICADEEIESWVVLDIQQSLVDKSLVVYDERKQRYRYSETVRAYGRELLERNGEMEDIRRRLLVYYFDFVESTKDRLPGAGAADALALFDAEQQNLRSAIEWGLEGGDICQSLGLANGLMTFFDIRGEYTEGCKTYQSLLAKTPKEAKVVRARGLWSLGILSFRLTRYTQAQTVLQEAVTLYNELGDEYGVATAINTLGVICHQLEKFDEATRFFEEALPHFERIGDEMRIAMTLNNLGLLALSKEQDFGRAIAYFEKAVQINRKLGLRRGEANNLINIAYTSLRQGDAASARELARTSFEMSLEIGDKIYILQSIEVLAPAENALDRAEVAAMLVGAKEATMESLGAKVATSSLDEYLVNVAAIRSKLGDEAFDAAIARGRSLSLEEAFHLSMEA
ncbi:MAG: tetratricopeptide repeat protein [Fimbriimonas sp.]|nr:tetratricopeptide repeat protein [Fimbriimonas sp.]